MKSYTDIEQSRKLAEILPIESADMFYRDSDSNDVKLMWEHVAAKVTTPCWSLAALLDILPKRYNDDNVYMPLVGRYYEGNHKFICGYFGDGLLDCTFGETPVDTCYKMILKLKENNLL